jgi:hypothetical protein
MFIICGKENVAFIGSKQYAYLLQKGEWLSMYIPDWIKCDPTDSHEDCCGFLEYEARGLSPSLGVYDPDAKIVNIDTSIGF